MMRMYLMFQAVVKVLEVQANATSHPSIVAGIPTHTYPVSDV